MKPHNFLLAALALPLLLASCDKKEESGNSAKDKSAEPSSPKVANDTANAAPEPTLDEWVKIENLGLQIMMPAGSKASTKPDMKERYSHIELDDFMVNVFIADEFSTKYEERIKPKPHTIKFLMSEKTDDGWVIVQKLNSSIHKAVRFDASVRVTIGDRGFDCGASGKTEARARTVMNACRTLKSL